MIGEQASTEMLLRPVDLSILNELHDGRNVAINLGMEIDVTRQYISERMALLRDWGLVQRVGPAENSGLYEITEKGEVVWELRDYRERDDFDELIDAYLEGEIDADAIRLPEDGD